MKVTILTLLLLVPLQYAQLITSAEHIVFPETFTGNIDTLTLNIENISESDVVIDSFLHYSPMFTFSDSVFTVPASGVKSLEIYYTPLHNVIDNDLIIYQSTASGSVLAVNVSGSGKYNDNYQSSTFNLYDNALKSALYALVNNHNSLGYNLARDKMYMEIDNKKVNGQGAPVNTLECVYTGREAVGYIDRQDCQNNYGFNTEHTWPQSYFGSNEPMLSDLFHLYPTDATANNIRGNLHFGKAVTSIDWQVGGSKRGRDSLNELVFEPRDVHKGNVARSLLYFTIRYTNLSNFLDQKQEDLFRIWNYSDPADTIEKKRNSDIAFYQFKRNPFIDHPEFVDRIFSFRTNQERPKFAILDVLPEALLFDSTDTGDTSRTFFYILNSGNEELLVNGITVNEPFNISGIPSEVNAFSFQKIFVHFAPDSSKYYVEPVVINSSAGIDTIFASGYGTGNVTFADNYTFTPAAFQLYQNYPNPFNPETRIRYTIPQRTFVTLKVYDIMGRETAVLVDDVKEEGNHEITFNSTGRYLSSGVYYYRLSAGAFSDVKKFVIIK